MVATTTKAIKHMCMSKVVCSTVTLVETSLLQQFHKGFCLSQIILLTYIKL